MIGQTHTKRSYTFGINTKKDYCYTEGTSAVNTKRERERERGVQTELEHSENTKP